MKTCFGEWQTFKSLKPSQWQTWQLSWRRNWNTMIDVERFYITWSVSGLQGESSTGNSDFVSRVLTYFARQLAARTPARRVNSRTNTIIPQREESPPPAAPERIPIRSRINSQDERYRMQTPEPDEFRRPILQRTNTTPASFEGPTTSSRRGYIAEPPPLPVNRSLRSTPQSSKPAVNTDVSSHGGYSRHDASGGNSPTGNYGSEGASPVSTSHTGHRFPSRPASNSNLADRYHAGGGRAPPPPAPRSIGKKPPPPPPPAKRAALTAKEWWWNGICSIQKLSSLSFTTPKRINGVWTFSLFPFCLPFLSWEFFLDGCVGLCTVQCSFHICLQSWEYLFVCSFSICY